MGECPFCGGEVAEELTTFGGTCPKCFVHIPGEEAATDPGDDVKAALEASDRARSKRRALMPVFAAIPVVLGLVGVAAWYLLRPVPTVDMLDFDLVDSTFVPEIVAAPEPVEEAADEAPVTGSTARVGSGARPAPDGGGLPASRLLATPATGLSDGGLRASDLGTPTQGIRSSEEVRSRASGVATGPASLSGGLSTGGSGSGTLDFGLDVTNERKAGVLEDPEAIRQMIAERMSGQMQQLNSCYERQLKAEPGLSGRWRIRYTVGADGTVRDASVVGLNGANREFEQCMIGIMNRWRFGRIIRDQPVQRTVAFRPL